MYHTSSPVLKKQLLLLVYIENLLLQVPVPYRKSYFAEIVLFLEGNKLRVLTKISTHIAIQL